MPPRRGNGRTAHCPVSPPTSDERQPAVRCHSQRRMNVSPLSGITPNAG
ncbi:MAG: hypothetical protein J6B92_12310 [Paraprevotella sp.]|nr:hypothetical protein [Paraprevotella sp.]MBP3473209.1 hypothetical protein [Paraprevotella sp.]